MRRRTFLLTAATLIGSPGLAHAASQRRLPEPLNQRRITLRHAASGHRFSGPYHNGIKHDDAAMAELSQVLADTRTGKVRPFDPAAIDIIWELGARQRMSEFIVLSGYRTPETNAAVHGAADSQHLRAAALDLQIPTKQLASFGEAARALRRGGVGTYPQRGFVHVDSGPVRSWVEDDGVLITTARATTPPPPRDPRLERIDRMAEAWANSRKR